MLQCNVKRIDRSCSSLFLQNLCFVVCDSHLTSVKARAQWLHWYRPIWRSIRSSISRSPALKIQTCDVSRTCQRREKISKWSNNEPNKFENEHTNYNSFLLYCSQYDRMLPDRTTISVCSLNCFLRSRQTKFAHAHSSVIPGCVLTIAQLYMTGYETLKLLGEIIKSISMIWKHGATNK